MTVLLNPTALRALLIAVILACAAALTAPAVRGAEHDPSSVHFVSCAPSIVATTPIITLADEWSWREFVKFWERQAGSMSGVLGTVLLVGAGAVLLIMSNKGR
jgi:hypothetical protein